MLKIRSLSSKCTPLGLHSFRSFIAETERPYRNPRDFHRRTSRVFVIEKPGERFLVQPKTNHDFSTIPNLQEVHLSCQAQNSPMSNRGYETHTESVMMTAMEKMLGKSFSKTSQIPPAKPLLIIISGPSGVGKDAVINRLQSVKGDMHFVVTATSRPKREGEVEGKDYIFLDREQFEDMIQRGDLLEHAVVYGDYKGIPKQQVRKALAKGTDVVLRLDVQGAATIRKLIPNSISIFLVAENERALTRRLLARKTEPLDKALVRVETAQKETQRIEEFDYVVENLSGQLEETVQKICSIIDAEKMRVKQRHVKV